MVLKQGFVLAGTASRDHGRNCMARSSSELKKLVVNKGQLVVFIKTDGHPLWCCSCAEMTYYHFSVN